MNMVEEFCGRDGWCPRDIGHPTRLCTFAKLGTTIFTCPCRLEHWQGSSQWWKMPLRNSARQMLWPSRKACKILPREQVGQICLGRSHISLYRVQSYVSGQVNPHCWIPTAEDILVCGLTMTPSGTLIKCRGRFALLWTRLALYGCALSTFDGSCE